MKAVRQCHKISATFDRSLFARPSLLLPTVVWKMEVNLTFISRIILMFCLPFKKCRCRIRIYPNKRVFLGFCHVAIPPLIGSIIQFSWHCNVIASISASHILQIESSPQVSLHNKTYKVHCCLLPTLWRFLHYWQTADRSCQHQGVIWKSVDNNGDQE